MITLCCRLFFLTLMPTENVVTQYQNQQNEVISEYNYMVLDTSLKDMIDYKKEFIVVIDKKPFSLNSFSQFYSNLLTLNYILKEEDSDFSFSDIMASEGKNYFKVSEEAYNKINKITNIKGVYTYIRDTKNTSEAWSIGNYLGSISKEEDYSENSLQSLICKYTENNNIPKESFILDETSQYVSLGIENISSNKNLKLTINSEYNDIIKKVLTSEKYSNINNLGVILMESNTGKIRAMVQKDESEANVNLCVDGIGYEPGSVYKLITLGAALEEGKVTMNDVFNCTGKVCSSDNTHGWISVENALNKSCNDTFAEIGSKVGYKKLMEYSKNLGLFEKVLDLDEESRGVKPEIESGLNNISIGQCFTVSPLQMLGAVNAIVNDGVYVKPYIIEGLTDKDDNLVESFETDSSQVFSETTAKIVKNGMVNVVQNGTGVNAKVDGYVIGGKTGSATSGAGNSVHAWFVGFFTYEDVQYTMVVFVPNIGESDENGVELGGGNTAAPIFSDIVENIIKIE